MPGRCPAGKISGHSHDIDDLSTGLDTPYPLTDAQIRRFRRDGFIQVMNLWEHGGAAREFVFGKRLAGIAAALLEVEGVRLYHDQSLYKEPGGGITPAHADQYYWPLSSDRAVTAWVPLQAVPRDMGPLAFFADSQNVEFGRDLGKLDYLKDLGVTSLLLTTLQPSPFYHNYFPTDFEAIDPAYGTREDYIAFVRAAHERGLKVYLDQEIQYLGEGHPWWTAALADCDAPEADWLLWRDRAAGEVEPFLDRATWGHYDGTPVGIAMLDLNNAELRDHFERVLLFWADPPGAEAAAALCALPPAWFSRRFKRLVGLSWSEYVRLHRLHLASQRLLEGDEPVAAIAEALGFSSPSHVGELFGQRFGMPPAAYRRSARAPDLRG